MTDIPYRSALIIGAGPGISASLTRLLRAADIPVVIASRRPDTLRPLVDETGAIALPVDAAQAAQVERLFVETDARIGAPELVVYNASGRVRGPIVDLNPAAVEQAVAVSALGAFYAVQQAAKRMVPAGKGAILLTGATAGVKGFARSAPFAMGKFALRGLAQSAARELTPKGIHVAHIVVDGGVRVGQRPDPPERPTAPSTPTRSRSRISTCCANTAVPGPGNLRSGLGSRSSEQAHYNSRHIGTSAPTRMSVHAVDFLRICVVPIHIPMSVETIKPRDTAKQYHFNASLDALIFSS